MSADDDHEERSGEDAVGEDAEVNLLSSPIERTALNRVFVIGGPVALAVTIVLSLWVSWAHVRFYTAVHGDAVWVPGHSRALRVQVASERGYDPGTVDVLLAVEQAGKAWPLQALPSIGLGIAQGNVVVPEELSPGPARLHMTVPVQPEPIEEWIELEISDRDNARSPTHYVSASMAQYSDDTDPQPEVAKLDIRAAGRVQTGFDNQFYVRVTDPAGKPWAGPVEIAMRKGELGEHVATPDAPVTLVRGMVDRLGLLSWSGMLLSETLRLEVKLISRSEPGAVVVSRTIMLVSFAGTVKLQTNLQLASQGDEVELAAFGLSDKRKIYIDVHDGSGAWIETLVPAKRGEAPRVWPVPKWIGDEIVQLEAYDQPNAPGESTAVARLQVGRRSDDAISLRPLIEAQKQALSLPRTDASFDKTREGAWLDHVGALDLSANEVATLRDWLITTLPVAVHGPPALLSTKQRDDEAMAHYKQRWTLILRWVLLGGGGLFLAAMGLLMVRSLESAAARTLLEMQRLNEGADRALVKVHVDSARREALLRGLGLIAVMAGALVLAVIMLEQMVWEF